MILRARHDASIPTDATAKVERMKQGVILLEPGAARPRILYRMLFERGLKDQHLRCSLHRILDTVSWVLRTCLPARVWILLSQDMTPGVRNLNIKREQIYFTIN